MSTMPELKCDWATHEAAKYACEHWHYSKCLPVGKIFKIGAWEDGVFIGVVLFSRGANCNMAKPYGLDQTECVELTRIALRAHKHFVSEIMMQAIKNCMNSIPDCGLSLAMLIHCRAMWVQSIKQQTGFTQGIRRQDENI